MSFSLLAYSRISGLIDGAQVEGGSCEVPSTITLTGLKHDQVYSIANAANTSIFGNTPSSPEYFFIQSDYNTRILITDNASNAFSLTSRGTGIANKYGPAIQIASSTTNTSTVINSIVAFNESGSTAKVRIIVVK